MDCSDYTDGEDAMDCYDDDDNDYDADSTSSDDGGGSIGATGSAALERYTVLTRGDIVACTEYAISNTAATLSVPPSAALLLLRHCGWVSDDAHDAWFSNPTSTQRALGLISVRSPPPPPPEAESQISSFKCGICLSRCRGKTIQAAPCGHGFCDECWSGYVNSSIDSGSGCLSLPCPEPSCRIALGRDFTLLFATAENQSRYSSFLSNSYVEQSRTRKWCPVPDCDIAVEFSAARAAARTAAGDSVYDVSCSRGHGFCWNCSEESHRPVSCSTVAKWNLQNSREQSNAEYILAYCKPCPKCKRMIEKNKGCMHMTCFSPCLFQFCWLCLCEWKEHDNDYFSCNKFKEEKNEGKHSEEEKRRRKAQAAVEKYVFYYERWQANDMSRRKAAADLQAWAGKEMEQMSEEYGLTAAQMGTITDAWHQIVECRRVLKWTYAYGFYLDHGGEKRAMAAAKKSFFEYLQGEAEAALERLHKCAEEGKAVFEKEEEEKKEKEKENKGPWERTEKGFVDFSNKLRQMTRATGHFFGNLVRALEAGLEEVGGGCSRLAEA